MTSVLVTGANRGIGLGITRHLLADPSVATVIATARVIDAAKELKALSGPKLHIVQLENVSEQSIVNAVEKVSEIVGDKGLDILVNNAGVDYDVMLNEEMSKERIVKLFDVNTIAPLLIANKFYPLLKKAASRKGSSQLAFISSRMGSLELSPNFPALISLYAMSKAALNMLARRISVEWKDDGIRATTFSPGSVATDMNKEGALTVDESTIPLTRQILSLTEEHNGQYYNYDGEAMPW